jgi:predicted homoserine dehydrogenase-like protein
MNLYAKLQARAAQQKPIRVALIGAGKFGSMFLAQAVQTPGLHITGIADLSPERVQTNLNRIGWEPERAKATSVEEAIRTGQTFLCEDAIDLIQTEAVEVVIDATGSPAAGIRHALAAIEHGEHIVMVNVEADTLAGPLLAEKARKAGVVYSLAYGDQPALIAEIVDWSRACGLSADLSRSHSRYSLAALWFDPRSSTGQWDESTDVQLIPGRYQVCD